MTASRAYNPNYRAHAGLPDPARDPQFYDGVVFKRFMAWILDFAFIFILWLVAGIVTLTLAWWVLPLWVVVDFTYRVLTLTGRSATWGMRAMGIELRDGFGQKFGFGQAIVHTALFYVSVGFILSHVLSIILMIGTARGQALHDIPLGSTAINRPAD
ncbi:RDD family protein [Pontivivens insulae]|uniref:RDD domain-containing protein n=1 Tax=Pontivivens insulae TaxID=1639689 RepID=A0A2R8AB11_9RHOB|nr:RDD family protein [Pontivivens insulae]RED13166.1 RDD family protein [Pontivivens insulae]SPF29258.1 hypothetical protein POI8812_01565 [Pontivivens insulae]